MNAQQIELIPQAGPVPDEHVHWLETVLLRDTGWLTAKQILDLAGTPDTETNHRWVRALASASELVISNNNGYRHLQHAPIAEITHAANRLLSQSAAMQSRALRLNHAAHRKLSNQTTL